MTLTSADRRLVRLFTAACLGNWREVVSVRKSAEPGEPDRRWREAVLQVHVFAGFPRLVEAYGVLADASGLGKLEPDELRELAGDGGVESPSVARVDDGLANDARASDSGPSAARAPRAPAEERALARDHRAGRALFERIYADDAPRVRAMLASHHSDFAQWIEGHAYGRVLARPGLAADRRELLAVAALAALGQERQLASHVRGSLRLGATSDEVRAALDEIADLIEPDRLERARRVVERFA